MKKNTLFLVTTTALLFHFISPTLAQKASALPKADIVKKADNAAKKAVTDTKEAVSEEAQKVEDTAEKAVTGTKEAVSEEAQKVEDTAEKAVTDTKEAVSEEAQKVEDTAEKAVTDTKEAVSEEAQKVEDTAEKAVTGTKEAVSEEAQKAEDTAEKAVTGTKEAVSEEVQKAKDTAEKAVTDTKEAVSEEVQKAENTAKIDSPLIGTSWGLIRIKDANGKVVSPNNPLNFTVTFADGKTITVKNNCNDGRGTWSETAESKISVSQIALTLKMCSPNSPVEPKLNAGLAAAESYTMKKGKLIISMKDQAGTLELKPIALQKSK